MYQTNRFHFTMRLDGKYFLVFSCLLVLLVCFPMQGRLAFNHNVKNIEFNYTIFLNFYSKVGDDGEETVPHCLTRLEQSSGLLFITYITASPFQEYDWLGLHRFNH